MKVSKSHFELTARIIKYALEHDTCILDIAKFFADAFENENEYFNREKFLKACGF